MKEQSKLKIALIFGLGMRTNPCNYLLFGHIDWWALFVNFMGCNIELSLPTSRVDNCQVPGTPQ